MEVSFFFQLVLFRFKKRNQQTKRDLNVVGGFVSFFFASIFILSFPLFSYYCTLLWELDSTSIHTVMMLYPS